VRWLAVLTVVVVVTLGPARALADDAPGLVVFHAPADAPASVLAARDALAARARRAGIAWIDRSPSAAPTPQAPALHRQAIEAYEALRFDEALAALDAAIGEAEHTGAAGLTAAELSDLFLYRGLTYTQRGDQARAWDDLVRAAVLDPARVLDPLRFPTRAVEAFGRARASVAQEARGELVVAAPAGCEVVVDGAAAAARVAVPYGEHFVRVGCAGRRPWGTRVTLAAASTAVTPALVADAPPSDAELKALAAGERAQELLLVTVALAPGAPPVLSVVRVDARSGKAGVRASVALAPGGAATPDAEAAFERVLTPVGTSPPGSARTEPRAWWHSPWVWAGVGAVVATAIVLPIALASGDSSSSGDVIVRPSGWTW
jgi:hypothetical protein